MDPATKALARGIKRLRKRRDLTVSTLAEAAGLSVQYVSMLERGQRSAKLETTYRLATALGVSPSGLLAEGERKSPRKVDGREELELIFEGLSEAQTMQIIKLVRAIRELVEPTRSPRGKKPPAG